MPTISITVPAGLQTRVLDAFAALYSFTGTDPQGAAETKTQFAQRILRQYVKQVVVAHEVQQAAETARSSQLTTSTSDANGIS